MDHDRMDHDRMDHDRMDHECSLEGGPTRRRGAAWLVAAAFVLVIGCSPATDGSVTLRPVERSGVWTVTVPPTQVGRSILVRHGLLRTIAIPRGYAPPPGMCRIWRPGVSPARQSPIGRCEALEHEAPAGSYLIYG
jgi:hypothetical protein